MNLADYLKQEIKLSDDTVQLFDNLTDKVELPKGHQLLKEGSHSKKVYFIEKGMLRLYYLRDGKDVTHFFHTENQVYAPIENIFLNQSYPYRLETLENSVLRTVDFAQIEKHIDENVNLQRFVRYVLTYSLKMVTTHLYDIQHQTAQERYNNLLKKAPDILQRVPLGHIASFLGISQPTLSVIRGEKAK